MRLTFYFASALHDGESGAQPSGQRNCRVVPSGYLANLMRQRTTLSFSSENI